MINFSFNLSNPWSQRWKNVWTYSYNTPFKNKFLELEVYKDNTVVSFMFRLSTKTDHGGLNMELGLLGYSFNLNFYDNRHWDYELDRYVTNGDH
jgi:hypothetical protein